MKKISLVSDGIYPNTIGGMQMHTYRLLKEWLSMGQKITLIYPTVNGEDKIPVLFEQYIRSGTLDLVKINKQEKFWFPWSYLLGELKFAKQVAAYINNRQFDVIYTQGLTGFRLIKSKLTSTKHVTNPHGLEPFQSFFYKQPAAFVYRVLFKKIFKNAHKVISLGGSLTGILLNHDVKESDIFLHPNGIAKTWVKSNIVNENQEKIKCLFVGRNEKRKGLNLLLEAWNAKTLNKLNLSIVGPVEKNDFNPVKDVNWLGAVNNEEKLKEIYDNHDVLICPSFAEGMPTVILEAMSRGLVIVATNVGATAELVSEKNGFLIPSNNLKELIKAIDALKQNSNLLDMKKNSLEKVKEFTWDKIANKTLTDINNL